MQHQLARNNQVQAARQRLAMRQGVPGGAQMGNLAGCGPRFNQGLWPVPPGNPVQGWTPFPQFESIPAMAPPVDPRFVAGPDTVLTQYIAPLSAIVQVAEAGSPTTIEMSCRGGSMFYASGISTCNECFQVIINSFEVGGSEYDLICGDGVDAAIWNTDDCYCPWDIGCISTVTPATVSFSAFQTPSVLPWLNMTLWGERQSGFRDCGYLPPWGFPGTPAGGAGAWAPFNGGQFAQGGGGMMQP